MLLLPVVTEVLLRHLLLKDRRRSVGGRRRSVSSSGSGASSSSAIHLAQGALRHNGRRLLVLLLSLPREVECDAVDADVKN